VEQKDQKIGKYEEGGSEQVMVLPPLHPDLSDLFVRSSSPSGWTGGARRMMSDGRATGPALRGRRLRRDTASPS
jgi:hypothetical protein